MSNTEMEDFLANQHAEDQTEEQTVEQAEEQERESSSALESAIPDQEMQDPMTTVKIKISSLLTSNKAIQSTVVAARQLRHTYGSTLIA